MRYLFVLFIFLSAQNSFGQKAELDDFFQAKSIAKAIIPDSILFGTGSASFITDSGDYFYVDNNNYSVYNFSSEGNFIRKFGQKGRGPGDFMEVNHIHVEGRNLYLLDYKNARFQVFDATNGTFVRTINLPFSPRINNEFFVLDEKIFLIGKISENELFVHELNKNGDYINSFGEFIDFSKFFMTTNGKIQLTQLHAALDQDQIIYTLGAPYRMFSYTYDHNLLWKKEDPILPKPWVDHIEVTPTSYRTKFYPTSFNSEIVEDNLIVYWLDPEKKEAYLDLRSKTNGELIQRSDWSYDNALIAITKAKDRKTFFVLTKNRNTSNLFLHELIIK